MKVVVRGKPGQSRSAMAFAASASVHGVLLGWLVLATPGDPEPRKSLYDQEIRPHEDHLVWYSLRDRLPDISPSAASKDRRPPRAHQRFQQTLVAGTKDDRHDRQMIWMPEPKATAPKLPPLPNVLAVATRPERPFTAPEMPRRITAPAPLPEAPKTPLALEFPEYHSALPLPPSRQFIPPSLRKAAVKPAAALPDAPKSARLALDVPEYRSALPLPPRRQFVLPPERKAAGKPVAALPDAPTVRGLGAVDRPAYQAAILPPPTRAFTPPPERQPAAESTVALPAAPAVRGPGAIETPAYHAAVLPPPTREFAPPPAPRQAKPGAEGTMTLPDAPAAAALPAAASTPAMAIAGLDPAKLTDLPKPPGPREAHFSAGPELREKGGTGGGGVVVPGLEARGGTPAPTATATLQRPKWMDPLHPLDGVLPTPGARSLPEERATRVSDAPDVLLEGRAIYTMAIQMPNVTSYSGSWMVWFAERASVAGPVDMQPPEPLRKVDPKYVATAVADRVEGKVRLSAIIRKDGHVDSVVLLRHLDARLDQTAEEALSKWIFQPARRNGVPIDVDAVFEIPFYLAPKPSR